MFPFEFPVEEVEEEMKIQLFLAVAHNAMQHIDRMRGIGKILRKWTVL